MAIAPRPIPADSSQRTRGGTVIRCGLPESVTPCGASGDPPLLNAGQAENLRGGRQRKPQAQRHLATRLASLRRSCHNRAMNHARVIVTALAIIISATAGQAIATPRGQSRATPHTPPPGWREAIRSTLDMTLAGQHDEVIAIYEKWVAKYPDFGDAHSMLCGAYEAKARDLLSKRVPDAGFLALNLLEKGAVHARRAFELGDDPRTAMRGLIDIYGPLGLNRPDEQERVIREAVTRYPAEPLAHGEFISLLMNKGERIETALTAARSAIPKVAEARLEYAELLLKQAQRAREPYRAMLLAEVERLTAEAKGLPKHPRLRPSAG
jgi:hypothetical protein